MPRSIKNHRAHSEHHFVQMNKRIVAYFCLLLCPEITKLKFEKTGSGPRCTDSKKLASGAHRRRARCRFYGGGCGLGSREFFETRANTTTGVKKFMRILSTAPPPLLSAFICHVNEGLSPRTQQMGPLQLIILCVCVSGICCVPATTTTTNDDDHVQTDI